MNSTSSENKPCSAPLALNAAGVLDLARECGATSVGIARAEEVAPEARGRYDRFLAEGRNAAMHWMERNRDVRDDPRLLLDGAESLIVCLFNYHTDAPQAPGAPYVARYALFRDYHKVLRKQLRPLCAALESAGHATRVCVDSAPLRERYWACRSGAAILGLNNQLIVPGHGSAFVVATVITTARLTPTPPLSDASATGLVACGRCGLCVRACPTGALRPDGSLDARRCLSYLTIEAPADEPLPSGLSRVHAFGCDACRLACPHSRHDTPTSIPDFTPRREILDLTAAEWDALTPGQYDRIFSGTPIRRASLERLKANLKSPEK